LLSLAALSLAACAVNPATGERQLMLVSEGQEIAMGREADPQISAMFGLYADSAIQHYVAGLGYDLVARAERPNLPWTFRVVDDPLVNAFALPGGYIYITRGIMAHFNSEAELVSVLGHEIGHVTARHSAHQISQQQLAQVGLVAGAVLVPEVQDYLGVAAASLQLLFLKFSRDDERQADDLGLRYMTRGGYDPREMPDVYEMLGDVSAASGAGGVPGWLSTHPDPEDRRERIERQIDTLAVEGTLVRQDEYLRRLQGMTYGDNPREGYFRENVFYHPDLAFRLDFPTGWQTVNSKQRVAAQSPQEDALIQLDLSDEASPEAAARSFAAMEGVRVGRSQSGDINGLPATSLTFTATTEQQVLAGLVAFVSYEGNLYRLMGLTLQAQWGAYRGAFQQSLMSFNRLADRTALSVQPLELQIVELDRPMTLEQFAQRYPSQVSVAELALINQVEPGVELEEGRLLKRVIGGPLPR
ncbi:MAG: M48 family metalloprotease, partial [Gemmatimonadota bacterium]